jgi:hypothetical protein
MHPETGPRWPVFDGPERGDEVSAETKAKMEEAIEAHLADECADPMAQLTGYLLQAQGSSVETNQTPLIYTCMEGQSGVVTLGLLAYMQYNAEGVTFDPYHGDDDDE